MGLLVLPGLAVVLAFGIWATLALSPAWLALAVISGLLLLVGLHDVLQRRHSVLRNFPVLGHLRFLLEGIRPELQQYFIERNYDGRPYDRDTRSVIYERAKGIHGELAFGTELDVNEVGYEFVLHSTAPREPEESQPRVRVGGPDCTRPYDMALLNVSAMSFGALSANALRALNAGAAAGGFAHDTGEGGLTDYHLEGGGDLIWEIGSGYFGARTREGDFDPDMFRDKAAHPHVKCVSLKLSQGAKPGIGGVLPAAKVTPEIAAARGVAQGEKCVSPAAHRVFRTPRELVLFTARMRELAGGKPVGFKLCVGSRTEVLAICKAMLAEGTAPDFIVVDGSEGGTGAAPLEFEDRVGMPLTEGLITMHNALVGSDLRERIALGAAGKVATGADIVKRLAQGADYTNAARAMMMAVGCIQAQMCHTNRCPVGVATQDPRRSRALDVADKSARVLRYQQATVAEAQRIVASMGLPGLHALGPEMLHRRVEHSTVRTYAELFTWLEPGELVGQAPRDWAADWACADPDRFVPVSTTLPARRGARS
ncbi:FMN-binding glutamate synthase family protein [Actinospica durhamensis]|uniref:FMN-binding glutamate synthase family protein n=1 Tax=Actinospica durhamensis TaxID=1508375 RepID=A0A941ENM7_9ACTN|nr:FMN-binding glutamate synthase family protein [Actinospica durhamensis]MBR7834263.1 FMN-binding glutamate synthase family protein [Actinospica durhamensis]